MRSTMTTIPLLALILCVVPTVSAQTEQTRFSQRIPFETTLNDPCNGGRAVYVTGEFALNYTTMQQPNGSTVYQVETRETGQGMSPDGTKYTLAYAGTRHDTVTSAQDVSWRISDVFMLVSHDGTQNFQAQYTIFLNPDGTFMLGGVTGYDERCVGSLNRVSA